MPVPRVVPHAKALVGRSVNGRTVIRFEQQTIVVVRRVFVPGNGIVGKFLLPMAARGLVCVIIPRPIFHEAHISLDYCMALH